VLLLSDYIAYSAMLEGRHVAYTPSYGPETRGGKAKCYVVLSDEEVDNPIVEEPDFEIIMNQRSMDFLTYLRPDGLCIYNKSLIDTEPDRDDVRVFGVPATEIADGLKSQVPTTAVSDTKMFANSVMFGAFIEVCSSSTDEEIIRETLKHFLGGKKEELMTLNYLAITKGREFVRANPGGELRARAVFHCLPAWASQ